MAADDLCCRRGQGETVREASELAVDAEVGRRAEHIRGIHASGEGGAAGERRISLAEVSRVGEAKGRPGEKFSRGGEGEGGGEQEG